MCVILKWREPTAETTALTPVTDTFEQVYVVGPCACGTKFAIYDFLCFVVCIL